MHHLQAGAPRWQTLGGYGGGRWPCLAAATARWGSKAGSLDDTLCAIRPGSKGAVHMPTWHMQPCQALLPGLASFAAWAVDTLQQEVLPTEP